ncbi:MAG TPA: hypothetical protein VFT91_08620 [Dehalococcoidia bacterium]|nr:hypothetical protein [Dehalococcoidia bacterium]
MRRISVFTLITVAAAVIAGACSASGAGGREVHISQQREGCTPTSITVSPGEKLKLVAKNETSKDYEMEGIEGANLEEVIVPGGRTRSVGFNVPDKRATYKIKCYVPGDVTTIIEIQATGEPQSNQSRQMGQTPTVDAPPTSGESGRADATIRVSLVEFSVRPDGTSVQAGKIEFVAENDSKSMVHELAVLRVKEDGSFENDGEIENLGPGSSGAAILDLKPGRYQLACLIAAGESGSPVDHYKQGMHTEFQVE